MAEPIKIRVDLRADRAAGRTNEIVSCGVPFPKGMLSSVQDLRLVDGTGNSVPFYADILDRWSDSSARWVLCRWQASTSQSANYVFQIGDDSPPVQPKHIVSMTEYEDATEISTGVISILFDRSRRIPLFRAGPSNTPRDRLAVVNLLICGRDQDWKNAAADDIQIETLRLGHACIVAKGTLKDARNQPFSVVWRIHCFAGSPTVRIHALVRNSNAADHPGGLWDLGNGGSILIKGLACRVSCDAGKDIARCSPENTEPSAPIALPFEIYQDSSGGLNWQSTNHLNRDRIVPHRFKGYRLKAGEIEKQGGRATPIVAIDRAGQHVALSMPYFWQNFPKALEVDNNSITLSLFPSQSADLHEIQGGEQKTSVFYIAFARDTVTAEPLAWTRDPLIAVVDPDWVALTGAVAYLTPRWCDPHTEYLQLVEAAIEGDDTFEHKREIIDEYGWRHFGDIYGDHEAVYHKGPTPLVSHYNNQYDAVAGLAYQFLRSGDVRWLRLMNELAAHVIDIDLYHTNKDKAAYNHGLFWHTYHYVDADTGTHRSYPKNGRVPPDMKPVPGGGPANEQNYATGLMLHYFMTGDEASKEAAVGLAQWVIEMDEGSRTPFRVLARGYTGLASQSRTPDYHGPGRGAANSISVLIDGHRLTGDRKFLRKAEQLLRRCIHPADNVAARNLLDAENRWFYTMFLQALGKYLDHKIELRELDESYASGRAALLHYARWMAKHEYPYLEKPEILEFPTETWVAQDMRKCEIFQFASLHADGEERERFRERAAYFFQYSCNKLLAMPTRTLCRPVVLLLSNGFSRTWFEKNPDAVAPRPKVVKTDFGKPQRFVPQKAVAIKRAKKLLPVVGLAFVLLFAGLMYWILR